MGFGDFFNKAVKVGVSYAQSELESVQRKMEQIERYKEQYRGCSDEELVEKYRNSSGERKIACAKLLKERGYGSYNEE